MKRRHFLHYGCLLATLPFMPNAFASLSDAKLKQQKFLAWCQTLNTKTSQGLLPYMGIKNSHQYSVTASCKLLLLHLSMGDLDSAKAIGDGLVYWHKKSLEQPAKIVRGGLPSEINIKNSNPLGDYYYASDQLLAIHTLLSLYEKTSVANYAEVAHTMGRWLEKTLFDGVRFGVWKTNYGPAMNYILSNGAVENSIHGAGTFLWLKALQKLHAIDGRRGWQDRLGQATQFMKSAQMPSGAWYTFFKPDVGKKTGKWFGYAGNNNLTIGDDNLRSALAAHAFGMTEQVDKFAKWLKPFDDTLLWGYLDTERCQPKFLPVDRPYYDVVCTGLLRTWYKKMGRADLADKCQQMLYRLQADDGSWYWGVFESDLSPINQEKAVITGCWALADIAG